MALACASPQPLALGLSVLGSHPKVAHTHTPMISQSHHHHHYQLTRNHYNPHSGFDAVSRSTEHGERTRSSLYICHCSRLSSYGLFWVAIYIAPAIHTLTYSLVLRFPSLFYGGCLFGSSCLVVASMIVTIRALVIIYMGEEAQERRLSTSTCPKATIPY